MLFSELPGATEQKDLLNRMAQTNTVPHALMFAGPEGTAKLALALAFATRLLCHNPTETDACGTCPACKKMQKLVHPDVSFLMPIAKSNAIKATTPETADFLPLWRTFCLQQPFGNLSDWQNHAQLTGEAIIKVAQARAMAADVQLKPFEAGSKVIIIWLPELMNPSAANAILKILEEPPQRTQFLLVNQNHEGLLPTITSRTQRIKVNPYPDQEIEQYLTQQGIAEPQAQTIALLAEGNLRRALDLQKEPDNSFADLFAQWMRLAYTRKYDELIKLSDDFSRIGREPQKLFLEYALSMLQQAASYGFGGEAAVRLRDADKKFAANFSKVLTPENLTLITQHINQHHYHLQRNANPKISFTALCIKIAQAFAR